MARGDVFVALAAAVGATNEWLKQNGQVLTLELTDEVTVKSTVSTFLSGIRRRKVSHWNWVEFYFRKVRGRQAFMFDLRRGKRPVALCLGTVVVAQDHVALDYLERRPYSRNSKGLVLLASFQFASAVARVLGLSEVRLNDPIHPALVRYYQRALDMTVVRQGSDGAVKYLSKKVAP